MTDTEGVQDRKDTAEPALEEQVQRKYTKEPSLQEHVAGICTTDDMTYTEEIQMSFPLENPDEDSETFTATEDQNPSEDFHSAWIGLQDMVQEGTFYWVNGDTIKWNVIYWMDQEPNNAMDNWDLKGQDCVAIVPPTRIGAEDWLNSWDDSVCEDRRHYICETTALILG
ncbi:hypothetical protein D5F01_LYC08923 [Larimichthys crocea]|uniref:C-type lectin domain-containing protein n=1 Tax=Larimichthys crocea TaxID=215358 RepID=A0A6G0IJ81_LARCR|nr:hypothetical protein D5F01_LYC08923 [Larimichthys crocea]